MKSKRFTFKNGSIVDIVATSEKPAEGLWIASYEWLVKDYRKRHNPAKKRRKK